MVKAQALNLRSGPGTEYDILGSYEQGMALEVIGRSSDGEWLKVRAPDGKEGWMALAYLQVNLPLEGLEVAQISPTPTPPQVILWTYTVDDFVAHLTVGPERTIYVGVGWDYVLALDADGSPKWVHPKGFLAVGPDGALYGIASGKPTPSLAQLEALDPANANIQWAVPLGSWGRLSQPIVGPDGAIYISDARGIVWAVNPGGSLRWEYSGAGYLTDLHFASDGTAYVAAVDQVRTLNPDGSLRWEYSTGGTITTSDGIVYIAESRGALHAVGQNGKLKWKYKPADGLAGRLWHDVGPDGTVYLVSMEGHLHALNADGSLRWKDTSEQYRPVIHVGADGTIYLSSVDEKLHAFDPGGELLWELPISGKVTYGDDGYPRVVSTSNCVYAVNRDGAILWKQPIEGTVRSVAVAPDETVYVGTNEGLVLAIKTREVAEVPPHCL
jgi:outer membrane protein assembly factor BamB